jgi:hypothetical protein
LKAHLPIAGAGRPIPLDQAAILQHPAGSLNDALSQRLQLGYAE